MNFEINLIFLIKPFFGMNEILILTWEREELLRWTKVL